MLLMHSTTAQPGITWLCDESLRLVKVDFHRLTATAVSGPPFPPYSRAAVAEMLRLQNLRTPELDFSPIRIRTANIIPPAHWMMFVESAPGRSSTFIMHTHLPHAFICPLYHNQIPLLHPIADEPPIPPEQLPHWITAARRSAKHMLENSTPIA